MNAEDLAAQVVRVRGAALIVPWRPARTFVRLRSAAVGGVVADGDVQIAGRVPRHPSTGVAALLALDRVLEKHLERSRHDARLTRAVHDLVAHLDTRNRVFGDVGIGKHDVRPAVGLESRIEREADKAFFGFSRGAGGRRVLMVDGDRADAGGLLRHRIEDLDIAGAALVDEDTAIFRDRERHRLVELAGWHQGDGLEARVIRLLDGGRRRGCALRQCRAAVACRAGKRHGQYQRGAHHQGADISGETKPDTHGASASFTERILTIT